MKNCLQPAHPAEASVHVPEDWTELLGPTKSFRRVALPWQPDPDLRPDDVIPDEPIALTLGGERIDDADIFTGLDSTSLGFFASYSSRLLWIADGEWVAEFLTFAGPEGGNVGRLLVYSRFDPPTLRFGYEGSYGYVVPRPAARAAPSGSVVRFSDPMRALMSEGAIAERGGVVVNGEFVEDPVIIGGCGRYSPPDRLAGEFRDRDVVSVCVPPDQRSLYDALKFTVTAHAKSSGGPVRHRVALPVQDSLTDYVTIEAAPPCLAGSTA